MTVQIVDLNNATHFTNVNISVNVNNSCTILPPRLLATPSVNYVPVGQSRSIRVINVLTHFLTAVYYTLNVTNNDNGTCGATSWGFGVSVGWPSAGWAFAVNPTTVANLLPTQTGTI